MEARWGPADVTAYGDSWKRMFFERHLEGIVELFIPDVTDIRTVLELVPLCRNYVTRLKVSQLLPPIKDPSRFDEDDASDCASDVGSDGPSMDHFDFGILLDKLVNLEELHVTYGVKGCGMNFEWNLFEFTFRDCECLAKALKSCKSLKVQSSPALLLCHVLLSLTVCVMLFFSDGRCSGSVAVKWMMTSVASS